MQSKSFQQVAGNKDCWDISLSSGTSRRHTDLSLPFFALRHLTARLVCIIVRRSRPRPIHGSDTGCRATPPPITGTFVVELPEDETLKKTTPSSCGSWPSVPAGRNILCAAASNSRVRAFHSVFTGTRGGERAE